MLIICLSVCVSIYHLCCIDPKMHLFFKVPFPVHLSKENTTNYDMLGIVRCIPILDIKKYLNLMMGLFLMYFNNNWLTLHTIFLICLSICHIMIFFSFPNAMTWGIFLFQVIIMYPNKNATWHFTTCMCHHLLVLLSKCQTGFR